MEGKNRKFVIVNSVKNVQYHYSITQSRIKFKGSQGWVKTSGCFEMEIPRVWFHGLVTLLHIVPRIAFILKLRLTWNAGLCVSACCGWAIYSEKIFKDYSVRDLFSHWVIQSCSVISLKILNFTKEGTVIDTKPSGGYWSVRTKKNTYV